MPATPAPKTGLLIALVAVWGVWSPAGTAHAGPGADDACVHDLETCLEACEASLDLDIGGLAGCQARCNAQVAECTRNATDSLSPAGPEPLDPEIEGDTLPGQIIRPPDYPGSIPGSGPPASPGAGIDPRLNPGGGIGSGIRQDGDFGTGLPPLGDEDDIEELP